MFNLNILQYIQNYMFWLASHVINIYLVSKKYLLPSTGIDLTLLRTHEDQVFEFSCNENEVNYIFKIVNRTDIDELVNNISQKVDNKNLLLYASLDNIYDITSELSEWKFYFDCGGDFNWELVLSHIARQKNIDLDDNMNLIMYLNDDEMTELNYKLPDLITQSFVLNRK